ncbi:MAG: hypothetical protein GWN58_27730 [Anaerolineae bacterium]|nr:hypothetical protein [Anaerolineae bacterium]
MSWNESHGEPVSEDVRYRLPLRHIIDKTPQGKPLVFSYHHVYLQALKGAGGQGLTVGQMRDHLRLIDKIEAAVSDLRTPVGDGEAEFAQLLEAVQEILERVEDHLPEGRAGRAAAAAALALAVSQFQRSLLVDFENGFVEITPAEWEVLEGPVRRFPYNGVYQGAIQLDDDLNAIEVVED